MHYRSFTSTLGLLFQLGRHCGKEPQSQRGCLPHPGTATPKCRHIPFSSQEITPGLITGLSPSDRMGVAAVSAWATEAVRRTWCSPTRDAPTQQRGACRVASSYGSGARSPSKSKGKVGVLAKTHGKGRRQGLESRLKPGQHRQQTGRQRRPLQGLADCGRAQRATKPVLQGC